MKPTKRASDPLGLRWIVIGAIFLCNPLITLVDILPDCIGLLMIVHGLSKISEVTDHLGDARDCFAKLAVVSAVQLCVVFTLPIFNTDSYAMLTTFTGGVLSAIFFLPGMYHLFAGFAYASMRTGGSSPNRVPTGKTLRGKAEKYGSVAALQTLTYVAFFVRTVGSVLPVIPRIFVSSYVGGAGVDWAQYSDVLTVLAFAVGLAVNIPWLLRFCRYITGIRRDEVLTAPLWERYTAEVASNKGYTDAKKMRLILILAVVACGLCFNMYVDYINILPNVLAAIFLFAVFVRLFEYEKKSAVCGMALTALWAVSAGITEVLLIGYTTGINGYTPASYAAGVLRAQALYPPIMAWAWVEAAFAVCAFGVLFFLLRRLLPRHIDAYAARFYRTKEQTAEECARIKNGVGLRLMLTFLLCAAASVLNGLYATVAPWAPAIWILGGAFSAAFAYGMYQIFIYMYDNLYTRLIRDY